MDWRFISFWLFRRPGESLPYWGGANDGQVHYPVQIDTVFLLDSRVGAQRFQGAISLGQPYGIYDGGT